ncbi:MAG: ImmA/IrrE family metallo-endopeptidase [Victivallales bacterium]|nr:ImmA/IrrE family metallo-endopeptidase [Victivallales bacterium]
MPTFNPTTLTLLREHSGLSQRALSTVPSLGLTASTLSKYESGVNHPSEDVLIKLANHFGVMPDFFTRSCDNFTDGLIFHRSHSALNASNRSKIEAEARLQAIDALDICRKHHIVTDVLPRNGRSPQEMAKALRQQWRIPAGPLSNVFAILETHNVLLIEFDFGTDLLDGFFLDSASSVICLVVNSNPALPPDRRRFSVLHELGHALLAKDMFPGKEAEDEANAFAAEFLAPAEDIKADLSGVKTMGHFLSLKSKWGMSIAALARRGRDLKLYSEATYRRICIFLSSKGLRKEEPSCGLHQEKAGLLPNLLAKEFQNQAEPWKKLFLSQETFRRRYSHIIDHKEDK